MNGTPSFGKTSTQPRIRIKGVYKYRRRRHRTDGGIYGKSVAVGLGGLGGEAVAVKVKVYYVRCENRTAYAYRRFENAAQRQKKIYHYFATFRSVDVCIISRTVSDKTPSEANNQIILKKVRIDPSFRKAHCRNS